MNLKHAFAILIVAGLLLFARGTARAGESCHCVAAAGEVAAIVTADVVLADAAYAHGDFEGALAGYAKAFGESKDGVLLYAQAMAQWQLGAGAQARTLLEAYLAVRGTLTYRAQAQAALAELEDRGVVGGVVGGVAGGVGGLTGGVRNGVGGVLGVGGAVGAGTVGTVGGLTTDLRAPRKKVARGAALVLGVVAVAAIGAVGIHAIAAGIKDDISLDAKFDLGLGLTGVTVGATALYLGGLTVATGAVGATCLSLPARKPMVAPVAMRGGGGLAGVMTF